MFKHYRPNMKTFCKYFATICCVFIQSGVFAQVNEKAIADSLFRLIADTSNLQFSEARPYYIIHWENDKPAAAKIIRQFSESTAIVEISTEADFSLLKQQIRIAPANNLWKYSPFVEQSIDNNNNIQQQFILSG